MLKQYHFSVFRSCFKFSLFLLLICPSLKQDRARHFAFRTPYMSYLIFDERLLDLEGYIDSLEEYKAWFRECYLH